MDALYDDYKRRRSEQNVKFKVQEMRKMNKLRDGEWHGVTEKGQRDSDSDDGSDSGGWDVIQALKEKDDAADSEDDSDFDQAEVLGGSSDDDAQHPSLAQVHLEAVGPVTVLRSRPDPSEQRWFDQDLFANISDDMDVESKTQRADRPVSMSSWQSPFALTSCIAAS